MGNTTSVEELGRGQRTTHKLSKPKVVNHETNTLLSPIGLSNPRRRFSTTRTRSLPYGTSPAPPSMWPLTDCDMRSPAQIEETEKEAKPRSRSITRTATALFRSRSSQVPERTRQRQDSLGLPTPSQSTRPSRANSMIVGASDAPYVQRDIARYVLLVLYPCNMFS